MKKRSFRVLFVCLLMLVVGCFAAACTEDEHVHEYTDVVTPPTCTEKGYTTHTCEADGENYIDSYVDALGHDWGEGEVTKEATCTAAGERTFTCSRCGETKTETVAAKGHTPGEAVRENEVAATCSEAGSYDEVVYCTVCNTEISRETVEIPTIAHTPGEAVRENEKAATCSEAGSYDEVVYCTVCETEISRETVEIPTIAHTPGEAVRENEVAATCSEAGSYDEVVYCTVCNTELSRETVRTSALGHDIVEHEGKAATCTEVGWNAYVTCSRCDYTTYEEIPATGHTPGPAATCTTAQTCTVCGAVITPAAGHTPGEAVRENEVAATCSETGSYEEVVYCTVCEEEISRETKEIAALGHVWDEGEVTKEAGCIFDGTIVYTCTRCKETRQEAIPAKGHDFIAYSGQAPTCTTAGWTAYEECSRCHYSTRQTLPALDHEWGEGKVTTEPTCTEAGVMTYTCSRCDTTKTETIPTLEHDWGEGEVTTEPTCTEAGVMTYTCSHCGETKTESIPETGHTEVVDPAVAPTCTATGLTEGKHCSVCNTVLKEQEVVPMLEHDWGEGEVTTEPTCTVAGVMTYTCSRCSTTKTEPIAALEHDWGEGEVTTEPTCTVAGVMTYTCSRCDTTKTEPITAKGHTEVVDPAVAATCSHTGLTEGKHCSVCNTVLVEQTEIQAIPHTFGGNNICSVCGGVKSADEIPAGNTVAVHDPSVIVAYADAIGNVYPDAGETGSGRQPIYFIFGTQLAAAYSYDMESWLMFTPTFYAEKENEEDPGVVSTDYTKIFKSAAAWPGYTDSDTIKGNLWAPDIIYNEDMGQWCLYYSMSGDSSNFRSSIFMMTSDNLTGPYEFVDFVVFSGFNMGTGAGVDDYKNVTGDQSVPSRYSNNKNAWNNDYGVSCIDPSVLYDKEGGLWLNYGSWSGGIFLIKLDNKTGLRDTDYDYGYEDVTYDATKTDALVYDPYLGVHIAGGWYVSGEGPYIAHMNGYYYLFLSYGFYSPEGGYNMRVFRSKTIDGRYEDMNGNWAVYTDAESNSGINYGGNVSKGEVLMQNYKWSWWTGPASLAQGHNSVLVDGDKVYLIYHIKYDDGTAHHNVEVHELVFGEDGWPLAAPFQKSETDKVITDATTEQLAGSWSVILHTPVDYENLKFNTDKVITLTSDGKVTGAYTGTWSLDGQYITITIGGTEYKGVVMEQQIEGLAGKNVAYTFTATNASTNTPLWGVKNPEGKSAADSVLNSLVLPGEILASINLPTTGDFGTTISYSSNNTDVLSNEGVYTAPTGDTEVTLTVTVTSGEYSTEKVFTINVLSEVSANAMVEKIVPEELTIDDFIVAKAAPLAGETVAPVSAINASTGVSLTFRVENISTDWDVIFRAPGKDAIVYLSVLNYLGVDIFEASATLSEEGRAILEKYYAKNPSADPDKDPIKDGASNWMLFLGSLCDNEDKSCIATISYNVDGSITFYRDGELMLTYAATTKIGESTVSALSKYMAEQVGSVGLEVAWPVEDLIIGYAADYTGACEHVYGAYDGDTATCIYCGATKVRVEVGEKTYEAEFVSRANAEKVNNTDTSGGWESWVPVGSKWVSGDFAVQYSWANTRDTNFYHDVALQLQTGGNYFTMNMLNGSAAWGTLATAEGVTHQGTVTKNGVETTAPAISSNPVGFSCEGVYTATMIRIGNVLIVRQTIALTSGDVWEAFDTFSGITQDDLYVELTANPYWADDIRVAVGTISEGMELGNSDNSTGYTGAAPLWTGSISRGQKVTATGTATSAGDSVWQGPIPYIWTGDTASLNFRPDNWINGIDAGQDQQTAPSVTVAAMNFTLTKVWQGFDPVSGNFTDSGVDDWVTSLIEHYNSGQFDCTITWDYTDSDVIVITMSYAWSDATFNQRYEVRATTDSTLLDTYSIGLGIDHACFKVDTITVQ